MRFLTFFDREVLEAAAPSVPRYQVELDEPRCELLLPVVLVVDRKGEDWERVGLFSTVLQCLVQHLGPRYERITRVLEPLLEALVQG